MLRYRLKLIQAANSREWRWVTFPTLTLPMLAAVTPSNYDTSIIDERVQYNDLSDNPDIVGISFECFRQERAFSIADHYHRKGSKVIFGGMHTTAVPEDVLKHCDSAVVGEAEEIWPKLLEDFENGALKRIYRQERPVDLSMLPPPRMDLVDMKRYAPLYPVESTRGCIYNCEFCFSKKINPTYRKFPIEKVVEECKKAKRRIFFMDDNLTADRNRAIRLLEQLKPLKKKLYFQSNLYVGKDAELLKAMKEAGVVGIFAGMESINADSLKSVHKGFNKVKDYEECIRNLKAHGIEPKLGVMFGFDHDDKSVFKRTLDFLERNGVAYVSPKFMIPFPGTPMHAKVSSEGRIVDKNVKNYDGCSMIVSPKCMSDEDLSKGYARFMDNYYGLRSLTKRALMNIHKPGLSLMMFLDGLKYYVIQRRAPKRIIVG